MTKLFLAGLIGMAAYVAYTLIKIKHFTNSVTYDLGISGIGSAKIGDLLMGIGTDKSWISVNYVINIFNQSDLSVKLKNLKVEFFHEDLFIGETDTIPDFRIDSKGESKLTGTVKMLMNKSTLELLARLKNSTGSKLKYKVNFRMFFIPITYWGETDVNV